jgi:hypothetical protein
MEERVKWNPSQDEDGFSSAGSRGDLNGEDSENRTLLTGLAYRRKMEDKYSTYSTAERK